MTGQFGMVGERYDARGVPVRSETVRVPLEFQLASVVLGGLGRLVFAIAQRPWLWGGAVVGWLLWLTIGTVGLAACVATTGALLVAWWHLRRVSFDHFVRFRARAAMRRVWVYRRQWQPAMVTAGLDVRIGQRQYLPELRRVRSTGSVDRVTVRMLSGQILDDYAEMAERLALSLDAVECRVRTVPPTRRHRREIELWFLVFDPLEEVVPVIDAPAVADFASLPVARREDGGLFGLRLLGSHVLVVGATGSGKGSVLWSLVNVLAPAVRCQLVELWVCDPKGGMEFAAGAPMFHRYSYGDGAAAEPNAYEGGFADFLEDAVAVMRQRQRRLRGITRLHEPTCGDPLVVVLVDELASLTAYVTDREARNRIKAALSLLLSQGRAVGVVVVAALQDPRKEVLPFRDLFPTRIALRLTEPEQVDMTLGEGARRRGAACDRISEALPGVGYVVIDGIAEPVRVRFAYVSDDHITAIAVPDDLTELAASAADRGQPS
ncbi:FtsK/SpoIIIE domain-containing protein [Nocardioides terrisoli]|uniref:FtsK/SpoIIIE domain-containing protein n=1 Tax=Nocardioides terrisoli TaxID=3388267 RepID=UPI00287BC240|nr:FtsK/SpoIIIE domain-containing protein [Nocardioides marmorisolisilvae]